MTASHYNQGSTHEQDNTQLAQLYKRMMDAPLRTYNQPDAVVFRGDTYSHILGLRLPLGSGACMLGIAAFTTFETYDPRYRHPAQATMTWGSPDSGDSGDSLKFTIQEDPGSREFRTQVLTERRRVGEMITPEEVTNPWMIAAVTELAYASLKALDQLAVPDASEL